MARPEHPNEPGRWAVVEQQGSRVLWRRTRQDPMPQTVFYLLDFPRPTEIFYDEAAGRKRLASLAHTSNLIA